MQQVNYVGNGVKSMHLSVNASLKKLRTDYIDILYVSSMRQRTPYHYANRM